MNLKKVVALNNINIPTMLGSGIGALGGTLDTPDNYSQLVHLMNLQPEHVVNPDIDPTKLDLLSKLLSNSQKILMGYRGEHQVLTIKDETQAIDHFFSNPPVFRDHLSGGMSLPAAQRYSPSAEWLEMLGVRSDIAQKLASDVHKIDQAAFLDYMQQNHPGTSTDINSVEAHEIYQSADYSAFRGARLSEQLYQNVSYQEAIHQLQTQTAYTDPLLSASQAEHINSWLFGLSDAHFRQECLQNADIHQFFLTQSLPDLNADITSIQQALQNSASDLDPKTRTLLETLLKIKIEQKNILYEHLYNAHNHVEHGVIPLSMALTAAGTLAGTFIGPFIGFGIGKLINKFSKKPIPQIPINPKKIAIASAMASSVICGAKLGVYGSVLGPAGIALGVLAGISLGGLLGAGGSYAGAKTLQYLTKAKQEQVPKK